MHSLVVALRFKRCRQLPGNVRNRELTICQRQLLSRLRQRHKKRANWKRYQTSYKRDINDHNYYTRQTHLTDRVALAVQLKCHSPLRRKGASTTIQWHRTKETRLDVFLVRFLFCGSIPQARQQVRNLVLVNGFRINKPFQHIVVGPGDIISSLARVELTFRRAIYTQLAVESIGKALSTNHYSSTIAGLGYSKRFGVSIA